MILHYVNTNSPHYLRMHNLLNSSGVPTWDRLEHNTYKLRIRKGALVYDGDFTCHQLQDISPELLDVVLSKNDYDREATLKSTWDYWHDQGVVFELSNISTINIKKIINIEEHAKSANVIEVHINYFITKKAYLLNANYVVAQEKTRWITLPVVFVEENFPGLVGQFELARFLGVSSHDVFADWRKNCLPAEMSSGACILPEITDYLT